MIYSWPFPLLYRKGWNQKIAIGKCSQKEFLVFHSQLNWYIFHTFHNKNGFSHSLGWLSFLVIYPAMYTRAIFISLEKDGSKFSRLSNISEPSTQSLWSQDVHRWSGLTSNLSIVTFWFKNKDVCLICSFSIYRWTFNKIGATWSLAKFTKFFF